MRRPLFHHHKHTGTLLHHRHTSYPVLFALALIVGGLIFMTDRVARADDLLVTATVPAPIPMGAPAFTAPADNTTTQKPSVEFAGTCPVITPAVIIALYEGTTLLGSGMCQNDGTFAVTVSFTPGTHVIIATVVTITGDYGASSSPLHVTYTPPATPPASTTTGTSPDGATPHNGTIAPLDIISEKPNIAFKNDLVAEWRGRFAGGVPPYTVTIKWGDGSSDTYHVSSNELQVFTHRYHHNRLYLFSISLQDSSGLSLTRNYVAIHASGAPAVDDHPSVASLLDNYYIDPYIAWMSVYLCLLMAMLLMWRYEHIHYPYRVIGVPIHYPWQKAPPRHQRTQHKKSR
ncbi:Ig-like domain repeat protein [Candidatus Saccharibacteria bacterium]|nr:MAG: Ig-like domain repeat protein [Candidatus Saccharibacteria bacterium]